MSEQQQAPEGAEVQDFGTTKVRESKGFNPAFMRAFRNAPYFAPKSVVVAGDPDSELGKSLAGTFLDDGRACLPWSADHERIAFGLLTGSTLVKVSEVRKAGGEPVVGADGKVVADTFQALVSDGPPEMVFLQGHGHIPPLDDQPDDWYIVVQDGRQRRRAAMRLQDRLDWVAGFFNRMKDQGKPSRRNALIKVHKATAAGIKAAGRPLTDEERASVVLGSWGPLMAELGIAPNPLPPDGDGREYLPLAGDDLAWLTETVARILVGDENALGEATKRGPFFTAKSEDAERLGVPVGTFCAYPVWLKVAVAGVNVDPSDPGSMLSAIAAKEAQVKTPPSLFAEQVRRIMGLKMNPHDPESPPLYSPSAVEEKLGKSRSTLEDYNLLHDLCPEVLRLIDSGEMSITFAVGRRESPFITWPDKQRRQVLPFDKQRLVLAHLIDKLASDGEDRVRFSGEAAVKIAKGIRDAAASGNLMPVGHEEESDDAPAPLAPTKGSEKPKPTADGEKPAKRARYSLDVAAFRAAVDARLAATDAEKPGVESVARLELARAVLLAATGAEPVSVLDAWPDVRGAVVAGLGQPAAPAAPQRSGRDLAFDLCEAAIDRMIADAQDKPSVDGLTLPGGAPDAAATTMAKSLLDGWVSDFRKDQSATALDEYLMSRAMSERYPSTPPAA